MNAKEVKEVLANKDVQAAVAKEVAKAVKAETMRIMTLVRDAIATNKETEDKVAKKAVAEVLKNLAIDIKEGA